jgi:surface antigen
MGDLNLGNCRKYVLAGSIMALLAQPVSAQFGVFSKRKASPDSSATTSETGCKSPQKKRGAGILGNVLGQVAGNVAGNTIGRTGVGRFVPVSLFSSTLSEAIACRLDPKEQEKAAGATDEALRSGKVGESAGWTSETRENVTGTSTVQSKIASTGGNKCMMVSDVIIVNGEETRADKKMCRGPGEKRYVLSA